MTPILLWVRRDLRLSDNPMLSKAAETGRPLIPVFVHDDVVARTGAAPRWRWGLGLAAFAEALEGVGARLILRKGDAGEVLAKLAEETGAQEVWHSRLFGAEESARDDAAHDRLGAAGVKVRTFDGHLLFDPASVQTGSGGYYKVYTPYWKAVKDRDVPEAAPAPGTLAAPNTWPASGALQDWGMGDAMDRGAAIVAEYVNVGEAAARGRLGAFLAHKVAAYGTARDMLAEDGTSNLSENLTYGEIGPRTVWHAGLEAFRQGKGDETFLKEIVWREFAYHLLHHAPNLRHESWRPEWADFPWRADNDQAEVWRRGRTGIEVVDAAMREIYVTGRMHNRARMLTASYLTKHLMTHWRVGCAWFEDCLIDWDVAANSMGWQWVAGSGPDAAPFFRVFNPETQGEKFDPKGTYRRRWLGRGSTGAGQFHEAIPRSWEMSEGHARPAPIVTPAEGRKAALDAFSAFRDGG